MEKEIISNIEYMLVEETSRLYPISLGTLRTLLAHRHDNGLDICVRKIGRKLLIRRDLFESWIEAHAESPIK